MSKEFEISLYDLQRLMFSIMQSELGEKNPYDVKIRLRKNGFELDADCYLKKCK